MLLDHLKSEQEKQSFANLAYLVARADGSISLEDMSMFKIFNREMAIPTAKVVGMESIAELCAKFTEPLTKEIIFTNLLSLAYTEKYTNSEQKQTLDKIRDALNISIDDASRQRDWIKMIKGSFLPEWNID